MESVCPACRTPLDRDTDRRGSSVSCPSCGKIVLLAASGAFETDLQTTMGRSMHPASSAPPESSDAPCERESVGRYRLLRALGHGGFGVVYLARDEVLGREVAVKLPRRDQFTSDSRFEQFVREARMAAQLRHPAIVTVHDIGQTDDGTYYIVLEFLPGGTLREMLQRRQLPVIEAIQLFVQVADAVAYANEQGLIHRDLKPSNILLDDKSRPFVADFGLAFFSSAPQLPLVSVVGTPAYMAPEQVRGETHRLDRRTDVWGLGVIFYVMLTGRLPFSEMEKDIFTTIQHDDPPRPSFSNSSVPREVERICLKCLSKRMTDRYDTAAELAAELREWMQSQEAFASSNGDQPATSAVDVATARRLPFDLHDRSTLSEFQVVPKGLRFFTEHDAHFFLELLPGARDRDGLPESIRFWKQALESRDAGNCFTVGLLFGPSGCGKTSFLKAGVVPRLAPDVIPIYFEATSEDCEPRLLTLLRRRFPTLPASNSLTEILALLRDQEFLAPGKKLVLILDQFEQWLHQGRHAENGDLSRALRQCDGVRVQCLLSVRDDFSMAVTRFLSELEVPLVQGRNFGTVDRFDLRHAKKVLAAFGSAFGQLPQHSAPSPAQDRFLDQAVRELAEEDRVIPVRLSLFAEMIKSSPWTPESLRRVGGAGGLGVIFLEETFSSRGGNPIYQFHAEAARRALQEFLPDHGNIRGERVSRGRLISVVGYEHRLDDFQTLLRVLAHELRLITPADPENDAAPQSLSTDGESSQSGQRVSSADSYQLTHDYLVPAIRNWLTRRQRATARGRAELCLAERAAQWQSHPESRFLPSFVEWVSILFRTRRRDRTAAQLQMMRAANKYYGQHLVAIAASVLILIGGMIFYERRGRELTNRAVGARTMRSLLTADTPEVPRIIDELAPYRANVDSALQTMSADASAPFRHRLHATLALLPPGRNTVPASGLVEHATANGGSNAVYNANSTTNLSQQMLALIPETNASQLAAIAESFSENLAALGPDFSAACWEAVLNQQESPSRRLRFAGLIAGNSGDQRWDEVADAIVRQMSLENPVHLPHWTTALKPLSHRLAPAAHKIFIDKISSANQRVLAAEILATFLADDAAKLVDLVRIAEPQQFALVLEPLRSHGNAVELLQLELNKKFEPTWPGELMKSDWQEPAATLRTELEAADGFCHPSFAYCQSLPLDEFNSTTTKLRAAGYRPNLFRPYRTPKGTLVAAVWERDGKDWQLVHGRTADELRQDDQRFREMGYWPVDVTEETAGDLPSEFRFAGLWVQNPPGVTASQMYVYVPESEHQTYWEPLNEQRFVPKTNVLNRPASDQPHYTSVRWRVQGVSEYLDNWDASAEDLAAREATKWPLADLRVSSLSSQETASFSGVWWDGGGTETKALINLSADAHATTCRNLVDQGWRPATLSVAWNSAGERVIAASIWHRPLPSHQDLDEHARQLANLAIALLALDKPGRLPSFSNVKPIDSSHERLPAESLVGPSIQGAEQVWQLLCSDEQPRTRAWLIENLAPMLGDPTEILLGRFSQETDPQARANILLALVPSAERGLLERVKADLVAQLVSRHRNTPLANERSAAFALLRALGADEQLLAEPEPKREPSPERNWFTTTAGNTMVLVRGPVEVAVGAGGDDPDRESYFETRHRVVIPRSFAISATEVTVAEFLRYQRDHAFAHDYSASPVCPVIQVNILDAMRYCRWLGEQEGIEEKQQCYPPIDQITESTRLPQGWLDRTGYRLPTEAEWECSCRAGTDMPRPFGCADALLDRYALTAHNSKYHAWSVASRLPNAWGLFDMLGNVGEITMCNYEPYPKRRLPLSRTKESQPFQPNPCGAAERFCTSRRTRDHLTGAASPGSIGLKSPSASASQGQ